MAVKAMAMVFSLVQVMLAAIADMSMVFSHHRASGVRAKFYQCPSQMHLMSPWTIIHCSRKSMDDSGRSFKNQCLTVMVLKFLKIMTTLACKTARLKDDGFGGY